MVEIRSASVSDLGRLVDVHLDAFPDALTSKLGVRFLLGYYRRVIEAPTGIALIGSHGGAMRGFAVGFSNPQDFYTRMRAHRLEVAWSLAGSLIRNPGLLHPVLKDYRWAGGAQHRGKETVELASIAVARHSWGAGLGRALLDGFVGVAVGEGASQISLTTDADNNEKVRTLYESYGFELAGSSEGRTRAMVEYILHLPRPSKE